MFYTPIFHTNKKAQKTKTISCEYYLETQNLKQVVDELPKAE